MIRKNFNEKWRVSINDSDVFAFTAPEEKEVTLPYDAVIHTPRTATASSKKGCFENGAWSYKKTFFVPEERRGTRTIFEFEGVYQRAMIYINGDYAGQHPYGYTPFLIDADRYLRYGEENEINVTVRTADDSRWYTGAGIYRDVYMLTSSLVYVKPYSVKITTPDIDEERAVVCIAATLRNDGAEPLITANTIVELRDANGNVVAKGSAPCTVYRGEEVVFRHRLYVKTPQLWDVESPNLYTCAVYVADSQGISLDESTERFGIRSLSLDFDNGLRINGKTVKMSGSCIHHDNGPLGAVSLLDAERRRISLMKKVGFNAIRMSHHPASPALLAACDELGMLVMDEAFDMWTINKSDFDYALDFPVWWEHDMKAFVDRAFNHPSIIMYSIGNEIKETGSPNGTAWGRKLAEKIRELDSTRYITNGVNGMLSAMDTIRKMRQTEKAQEQSAATHGDINNMMTGMGEMMKRFMSSEAVTKVTEESFAYLDIAGYNYMDNRYVMDKELFPNRLIVGSETYTSDIDRNWRLVMDNSHVLGDFTWTGWDYLGEAGVGMIKYPKDGKYENVYNRYPTLTAMTGDIAITGFRRPLSYYREIVLGLRTEPYLAVQRPEHYHEIAFLPPWCFSDSAAHWSFTGFEGKPAKVEIYSHADEVELIINDKSMGRQPAGEANRFKAIFDTIYEAGEVIAVAYEKGAETGRFNLKTAMGKMELSIKADREEVTENNLVYVDIFLKDAEGNLFGADNKKIKVDVEGGGALIGFANANPNTEENFYDPAYNTFDGHALAVFRANGKDDLRIKISSDGMASKKLAIPASKVKT